MVPGLTAGGNMALQGGTARAEGGTASGMFDNSGFVVNYAPPAWVWVAVAVAVVAGVVWVRR